MDRQALAEEFAAQWKHIGELNGHVEEMYTGHDIVKAFGREAESVEKFNEINERLFEASWRAQFISGIIMPMMNFINNIGYVAICVVGGILVAAARCSWATSRPSSSTPGSSPSRSPRRRTSPTSCSRPSPRRSASSRCSRSRGRSTRSRRSCSSTPAATWRSRTCVPLQGRRDADQGHEARGRSRARRSPSSARRGPARPPW